MASPGMPHNERLEPGCPPGRLAPVTDPIPAPADQSVERLFPFAVRARLLIVGREQLRRSKSRLHFILVTHDLSESSRAGIVTDFAHYPVVQHYTSEDIQRHFGFKGTKVLGFAKSTLAQSIYAELKQHRLNKPASGRDSVKSATPTPAPGDDQSPKPKPDALPKAV
jgi:hypothetical protein